MTIRKADRDLAVGTAQIDGVVDGVATFDADLDTDNGGKWDEPETTYAAEYPRNHVYESEGGHLREMDDTPGAERIHERHASGSGYSVAYEVSGSSHLPPLSVSKSSGKGATPSTTPSICAVPTALSRSALRMVNEL